MNAVPFVKRALLESAHQVYQPAGQGPFRCDHCEYYRDIGQCHKPEIVDLRNGLVQPAGCCDYFERAK